MADSLERFTQRARRVLSLAHQEAERLHQREIGTEHLLLGLIQEEGGVAGRVLRELGLEEERELDRAALRQAWGGRRGEGQRGQRRRGGAQRGGQDQGNRN